MTSRITLHPTHPLVAGAVLAAALMTGFARPAHAQTERRTLSGGSVAVYDVVGRVDVEQGSGSDVVVEITMHGRDAKRLKVESGQLRGANTLRIVYPDDDIIYPDLGHDSESNFRINDDGTFGGDGYDRDDRRDDRGDRNRSNGDHRVRIKGGGSGAEAWADLRILVPAGKQLSVHVGVGGLHSSHVSADLRLQAVSARITVDNAKGSLLASAGSGGIDVHGSTGDDVTLESGSGGVSAVDVSGKRLRIESGSGGITGSGLTSDDLSINVGSGSIRVDDARAPRARLDAGSGGIHVAFASPVRTLDVQAGSGGVTVALPGAVNADVDIETGSGGIDSDFPVQVNRMERHELRGKIGDGSGTIRIHSGSGSVYLRKS